jgi:hypothetical protein
MKSTQTPLFESMASTFIKIRNLLLEWSGQLIFLVDCYGR